MSVAHPPAIEQRLSALVPRVRALRVMRGVCWLVVVALGTTSAVLLTDAAFPLPAWVRGLFLSVWLTAVGVLTWRWVLVPLRADIPLIEVARELEKQLPELGDRLRAAVTDDPTRQSDAVRSAVAEDTARRTKGMDFALAIPISQITRHAAVAVATIFAVVATITLVPGSSERVRRLAMPWHRLAPTAFRVMVRSGEQVVKRGDPLTLSAYAERVGSGPTGATPPEAVLILRDKLDSPERRVAMTAADGAFHITLPPVTADFEYCVEIGTNRSEWFHITALDAVTLADGTSAEIVAPAYAKRPKRTLTALTSLDGLQFSTVNFQLKFTHPAATAHLEWRPGGATKFEVLSLVLSSDNQSATGNFPLTTSGVLRLVLVRDVDGKKLRTETAMNVRVATDQPPWFEEVRGITARPRTVRPNTRLAITFAARDDVSVSGAVLEYVFGPDESKPGILPLTLAGAGTTRATGRYDFDLLSIGELRKTIRFRIRVTDNRAIDEPKLAPQETVYPPEGWSELKLDEAAPPLDQQDIVSQRDALQDALTAASQQLKDAGAEADALLTATAGNTSLTVDQSVRLNNAREKVREVAGRLQSAARDAALTPELRALADAVRAVADRQLQVVEDAFRMAETENPTARKSALTSASTHLTDAGSKLSEIRIRNAKLANDRLNRALFSALANDLIALADVTKPRSADFLIRQRELLARLAAITAGSDSLRLAVDAAKGEEIRRFAATLNERAAMIRDLDTAAKQTVANTRAVLVAAVTRDQDALTKRATTLLAKLDTPARLAGVALPVPDDFHRVAKLAAEGKTVQALAELEKLALELERFATAADKWHAERADPKLAAKQLALWQDDLLARVRVAAKAGGFNKLPDDAKSALRSEQKALHAAIEALVLPSDDGVKTIRTNAALRTARANDALALNGIGAEETMKLAVDALTRLSERTPSVPERLAKSLREFERPRQDLEASGNAVELVLKNYDRQPPDAATSAAIAKKLVIQTQKQQKLIAAITALDLPGLRERQDRVVLALKAAVADLQGGAPLDIQASQLWVRREFERVKLVLEGHPAPDAKAAELHRKLAVLADSLAPNITKQQLEPALPVVQAVQQQLALVVAVEAPALLNDARVAVLGAEAAFRDASPDEIRARIRAAADALGRLSDRLNGFESDRDRVKRLATSRRLAAEKPKEVLTSDEALRQFGREADELTTTRVGAAGQILKKRALDLYAKIRAKTDPDRIGTDLKTLAITLDELAAKMADIAELATGVGRAAPTAAPDADQFLPSRPLADALRDLARQQRALHVQITNLSAELANRLRPIETNPFEELEAKQLAIATESQALAKQLGPGPATKAAAAAALAANRVLVAQVGTAKDAAGNAANFFRQLATIAAKKPWEKQAESLVARQDAIVGELTALLDSPAAATAQQVARAAELAHLVGEFAERLEVAAKSFGPDDPTGTALTEAAKLALDAQKQLTEAAEKAAEGAAGAADKHRTAAEALLRMAAEKVAASAPPPPPAGVTLATGLALRSAESSMRLAADAFTKRNIAASQKAMRDAAKALHEAAQTLGK